MIFFLKELPSSNLSPNSLYFITTDENNAELFVTNKTGEVLDVATDELTSDQTTDHLAALKNAVNGLAGLDANKRLNEANMPASFRTDSQIQASIQSQVNALVGAAPGALDTLDELSNALGDDANFASTVTTQLAGKQATLSNAAQVAKIGDGTFDGKPLVVVSQADW